jgi:membrane protease YdiL (CAAX protease family)
LRPREFVHDATGRLRAGWRLAAFLAAFVVTQPFAIWIAVAASNAVGRPVNALEIGPVTSCVALIVAHFFVLRVLEKRSWSDVRLGREAWSLDALVRGIVYGALAIALPVAVLLIVGWMRAISWVPGSWWGTAFRLTSFFAVAALWEELAFRGYLFSAIEEMGGTRVAVGVTSVLFGAAHLTNPGATLLPVFLVMLAGVFLAGVMLGTRSLVAAWVAHAAFNWMQSVAFHAPVSGLEDATPDYRLIDSGPDWITGGAWGPEGGFAVLVGMAIALLVLSRHTTRPVRREEPRT